ncbi:EAL domain-containing protein [Methylophaga sp.]|uniref:EAL domain-containing protein n=1 Tax=Methylophaga sp. TaxID=2024840 RepID=UPI003F6976AB
MNDKKQESSEIGCNLCTDIPELDFDFSMAFQPIVDVKAEKVFGYEALVRGINQESAYEILSLLDDSNRYQFDQRIRVKAIQLASELNLEGMLSINFLPNAVYNPQSCIRATLHAAEELNFPTDKIMFEVTEGEKVTSNDHLKNIFTEYKKHNFTVAIDDFGAGYAGLNLLADLQPHIIKLDMALVRNIDTDHVRKILVNAMITACFGLNIKVIAEGVETEAELNTLVSMGIELFQGYLLARPQFETLPEITDDVWKLVANAKA